ncbi:MAG: S24 family peptidase [Gemmatimonadaceae bacterium]
MNRYSDDPGRERLPWWMTLSRRGDDLSAKEREELEARTDPLIDLIGYSERYRPESPAYDDTRFVAHLASERRAMDDSLDRLEAPGIIALRNRILESWHARRLGVRLTTGPVPHELLPFSGSVSGMLEELEREHVAAEVDLSIAAGEGRELWDAEVESCVPLPSEIPRGKYVVLRIAGDSMMPLLHGGDKVLIKLGTEPVQNTVVVARVKDGGFVAKKVGTVTDSLMELESLNPAYASIPMWREPGDVLGTVIMRWCSHDAR